MCQCSGGVTDKSHGVKVQMRRRAGKVYENENDNQVSLTIMFDSIF